MYGVLSMVVLARPNGDTSLPFFDRWIALIGFLVVVGVGLTYMIVARPYRHSTAPEGDAIEIADILRAHREQHDMAAYAEEVALAEPTQPVAESQRRKGDREQVGASD